MPWSQLSIMDQKTQFIADYLRHSLSFTELCALYHVSRKTGYKWLSRYEEPGAASLKERSHRPHASPHQTPDELVAAILETRRHHPTRGAKKLLASRSRRDPDQPWPSRSVCCAILSCHGLIHQPRRRRLPGHPGQPSSPISAPNEVWSADFKGQFKTRNGRYCYPLTVTDNFSHLLLSCRALRSTCVADSQTVFRCLFREYGLPQRIRTDTGVPFATLSLARLSRLCRLVGALRRAAGVERAGLPAAARAPRTDAPHAEGRDDAPARLRPPHTAALLRPLPRGITKSGRPRRWGGRRLRRSTSRACARTPRACRPWSTRCTSRRETLATTAASAGARAGLTSASPARASTSGWRRSTTASGASTSGREVNIGEAA